MNLNPFRYLLVAWFAAAVVRVILGSSTTLIAYIFFGLLWLISALLLIMAIRLLVIAQNREQRIEAVAVCVAMAALLGQGILGSEDTIVAATLAFFASLIVLIYIYARSVRRRNLVEQ